MLKCIKERSEGSKPYICVSEKVSPRLFFILCLISVILLISFNLRFGHGFKAYYLRGNIVLHAWKMIDYNEYRLYSDHEWGHYVYNYYLSDEDQDSWEIIVGDCGFNSSYAQSYWSNSLQLEEEFADCFRFYLGNQSLCFEKEAFIERWI